VWVCVCGVYVCVCVCGVCMCSVCVCVVCGVCVCVCVCLTMGDLETATMGRPRSELGCKAEEQETLILYNFVVSTRTNSSFPFTIRGC
jgi:hypothetical protein